MILLVTYFRQSQFLEYSFFHYSPWACYLIRTELRLFTRPPFLLFYFFLFLCSQKWEMYSSWGCLRRWWRLRDEDTSSTSTGSRLVLAELLGWKYSFIKPISLVPKMIILISMLWHDYTKRPLLIRGGLRRNEQVQVTESGPFAANLIGSWSNIVHGQHLPATVSERCVC